MVPDIFLVNRVIWVLLDSEIGISREEEAIEWAALALTLSFVQI